MSESRGQDIERHAERPCISERDIEVGEVQVDKENDSVSASLAAGNGNEDIPSAMQQAERAASVSLAFSTLTTYGRLLSRRLRITGQPDENHVYDLDGIKIDSPYELSPYTSDGQPPTVLTTFDGLKSFVRPVGSMGANPPMMRPPVVSRFFSSDQRTSGMAQNNIDIQASGGFSGRLTENETDYKFLEDPPRPERVESGIHRGIRLYFQKWKGANDSPLPRPPLKEIAFIALFVFIAMSILSSLQFYVSSGMDGFGILVPSCGASAILIFGLPESKMAQPRTIIGGQLISSFVGVSVRQALVFKDHERQWFWLSGPISCSISLALMQLTRTTNLPGGAAALAASMLGPDQPAIEAYKGVVSVLLGNTMLVYIGVILNNLRPSRQYPTHWW